MNTKKTFSNQELFSFCFKDEVFDNPNQFMVSLPRDYRQSVTETIFKDVQHNVDLDDYSEYQLDIDVGQNFFFFAYIKVWSDKDRIAFLDYQYSVCDPEKRLTMLYRIEAFASVNMWYTFGEYSRYEKSIKKTVLDWVMAKYTGKSIQKPKISMSPLR